ncbi:hypothetical protein [Algibacter sp. 2305UL17-15]|uniref:LVIVD repeat-containing protein n=1 Tax=Algibacter sp. 2305UL17-15 TaxID=3231268 RepID=UPI0034596DFC
MKSTSIILGIFMFLALFSCDNDDEHLDLVTVATPELMSKSSFRKAVAINAPQPIKQAGKIYAYGDYIFVNDVNKGVHVIDNSQPNLPKAIRYIAIPGNEDISVKDNFLYADSATDLVVFDISDINNIKQTERLEDVFEVYNYQIPIEAEAADWGAYNYETDIVVGWTLKQEQRENVDQTILIGWGVRNDALVSFAESTVGVGGSLARFQIVNNFLYTVGSYSMSIFNIQDLANPVLSTTMNAGWNIETMFAADNYLYLGSTNGMYIYDLKTPSSPEYVSEFTHWEGCDPVVVDGDYAYLTLRGGNACGQLESVLEVIDIKDKTNPTLAKRYTLENPYGLGIKGNMLYVCDGTAGLKLFERKTSEDLKLVKTLKNIQATDVIPLENSLIMIGGNTLYQYRYMQNNVGLISSYSLN